MGAERQGQRETGRAGGEKRKCGMSNERAQSHVLIHVKQREREPHPRAHPYERELSIRTTKMALVRLHWRRRCRADKLD
eukprot:726413-Pleurochrysis_carterae.AAC.2